MSNKFLVTAVSLNMFELPMQHDEVKKYKIIIRLLSLNEFCEDVRSGNYMNAIGHQATADMINTLCNTDLKANRIEVKLPSTKESEMLVVQLMFRPPEGKVFTKDELMQMADKIRYYKVIVQPE